MTSVWVIRVHESVGEVGQFNAHSPFMSFWHRWAWELRWGRHCIPSAHECEKNKALVVLLGHVCRWWMELLGCPGSLPTS